MMNIRMLAVLGFVAGVAGCASTGGSAPAASKPAAAAPAAPAAPAAAAGGGSCAGDWKIEVETPMGTQTSPLKLAQNGDQVTGATTGPDGSESPVSGTCSAGGDVTLTTKAQTPVGEIQIDYNGKVAGNSISGMAKFGDFGEGKFSATK